MLVREIYPEERETYNETVSHILQSYEWGLFKETTGVKVIRLGFFEGFLKSGFQLTFHPFPHTPYYIGYYPRGLDLNESLFEYLLKIGRENNCIFIKIDPNLQSENFKFLISNKTQLYKAVSILPRYTFLVSLKESEDEILNRMKEKTRYNIKLAQKHEVIVEEKNDQESLEIFIKLTMDTAKRQGFFCHPPEYYRKLWEILFPYKMVYLLVAKYKKVPLASILLFKFKDQLYYPYGGSATIFREKMPNHLLHWEAIKLGKKLGCTSYDLWGAYKNSPTQRDPWFGIYRFKEGFGGDLVTYPESQDLVLNGSFYKIYQILETFRYKFLALKRFLTK